MSFSRPGAIKDVALPRPQWTMEEKRLALYALCAVLDLLAVTIGFVATGFVRDVRWLAPGGIPLVMIAAPLYVLLALARETYTLECLNSLSEGVRRALGALIITGVTIISVAFYAQFGAAVSRVAFTYAMVFSAVLLVAVRVQLAIIVRWGLKGVTFKKLLILDGQHYPAEWNTDIFDARAEGLHLNLSNPAQLARISHIVAPYDRVILGCDDASRSNWITILKAAGVSCDLLVSAKSIYGAVGVGQYGPSDTLVLSHSPLSLTSRIKKRLCDLVLTIPLLILVSPLMLLVAIAIRLESRGPALFTQTRVGLGNRPFRIYKFRSMRRENTDHQGTRSALRNDDRITRIGRLIRCTSIDELPQLFNVLIGNMSLVGPRPHALGSTAGDQLFWEVSDRYWMRHALKPGITGLAQIRGFRGSTEKREDLEARLRYDLEYVQSWSIGRDLTILLATIRVVTHANAF